MKSIEDALLVINNILESNNSPLAGFTQGSNAYILFRTIALLANDLDVAMSTQPTLALDNLRGSQIDYLAQNYNLYRADGKRSTGTVLIQSANRVYLPVGTIITNQDRSIQFETTKSISVHSTYTPIEVVATNTGNIYLEAGIRLYIPNYPQTTVYVGSSYIQQRFIGNISGGREIEDDNSFKVRIKAVLSNIEKTTEAYITNTLRTLPYINMVKVLSGVPSPGIITIYTNNINQIQKAEVEMVLNTIKAAGVITKLIGVQQKYVDIAGTVTFRSGFNLTTADSLIRNKLSGLFSRLDIGQGIKPSSIESELKGIEGVLEVNLTHPTTDVVPTNTGILSIKSINFYKNTI
jgi:uncharacterized phage protein gp47/JayE